jgi:hypothetical protein
MYIGEYSSLFSKAGQNNIHVIKKERERECSQNGLFSFTQYGRSRVGIK